jgi:cell division FtsZ-interacting protein ZapD
MMTERQEYQTQAAKEVDRFREWLREKKEEVGETNEKLEALEQIVESAGQAIKRLEEAGTDDEWEAAHCRMDGVLSEMRNAVRNVGMTLSG